MRIVQVRDGALELRWTWMPYWLAVNPKLKLLVEREVRDSCLLCGVSNSDVDLDAIHDFVIRRLKQLFPFRGLDAFLDAMRLVDEPT